MTAATHAPDAVVITPSSVLDREGYCDVEDDTEFTIRRLVQKTLDAALVSGSSRLDLSFASRDAVFALPDGALHALGHHLSSVVLPSDLRELPPWLYGLTRLKEIDLPGFTAVTLNVTAWELDLLRLPAAPALRTVHAAEGTVVTCPHSGIGFKVCVHYYRDGERTRSGAAGSRVYWKNPMLAHVNYNGLLFLTSGKRAFCRHLSVWRASTGRTRENGKAAGRPVDRNGLYDLLQQLRITGMPLEGDWEETWNRMRTSRRTIMVGNDLFGEVIADELRALAAPGERKRAFFLMETLTHAMLLELSCKGANDFAVALYDPNVSLTHTRIRLSKPEDMKRERIENLIDAGLDYFKDMPPVVLLLSLEDQRARRAASADMQLSEAEIASPLPLLLSTHEGFDDVTDALFDHMTALPEEEVDWEEVFSPYAKGNSVIHHAIQNGNLETLRKHLDFLIGLCAEGDVPSSMLRTLLTQTYPDREDVPTTLMHLLATADYCPLLEVLVDALQRPAARSIISPAMLTDILLATGSGLASPLRTAIARRDQRAISITVATVVRFHRSGQLGPQSLERVLVDVDLHGQPLIASILASPTPGMLQSLFLPLMGLRNLPPMTVHRIFGTLDWHGISVMRAAYATGKTEFLRIYAQILCFAIRSNLLNAMDAVRLLFAPLSGETLAQRLDHAVPSDDSPPTPEHLAMQAVLQLVLSEPTFMQNLPVATCRIVAAARDVRIDAADASSSDTDSENDSLASDTEDDDSGLSDLSDAET